MLVTQEKIKLRQRHASRKSVADTPPLENGDCLVREEFERRYNAMPSLKNAELIEGRVYMSSAVKLSHGESHAKIITWLGHYCAFTPGLSLVDNATIRMDDPNEPQPDASLRITAGTLGHSSVSEDGYIEGPPEFIVEIAGTSASYDLHEKFSVYQRNEVQEYLVWQVYENQIDWFSLVHGQYESFVLDADGILRSRVFPGLYLAAESLLAGDMARVLTVLQQGLQSKEHAEFVTYLQGEIE